MEAGSPHHIKPLVDSKGSAFSEMFDKVGAAADDSQQQGLDTKDVYLTDELHELKLMDLYLKSENRLYLVRVTLCQKNCLCKSCSISSYFRLFDRVIECSSCSALMMFSLIQ